MCRYCRFEKCLNEGMLTSSVQNKYKQSSNNSQNNFLSLYPSESGIGSKIAFKQKKIFKGKNKFKKEKKFFKYKLKII
jgi:hypothetical protein